MAVGDARESDRKKERQTSRAVPHKGEEGERNNYKHGSNYCVLGVHVHSLSLSLCFSVNHDSVVVTATVEEADGALHRC